MRILDGATKTSPWHHQWRMVSTLTETRRHLHLLWVVIILRSFPHWAVDVCSAATFSKAREQTNEALKSFIQASSTGLIEVDLGMCFIMLAFTPSFTIGRANKSRIHLRIELVRESIRTRDCLSQRLWIGWHKKICKWMVLELWETIRRFWHCRIIFHCGASYPSPRTSRISFRPSLDVKWKAKIARGLSFMNDPQSTKEGWNWWFDNGRRQYAVFWSLSVFCERREEMSWYGYSIGGVLYLGTSPLYGINLSQTKWKPKNFYKLIYVTWTGDIMRGINRRQCRDEFLHFMSHSKILKLSELLQ